MPFTVLRLGALVDSAGGIPLTFGSGDAQLLERCADGEAEPPLISRNDAARTVVEVVRQGLPRLGNATVDVAWQDKWGMSSVGTEEASRCASRQDLVGAADIDIRDSTITAKADTTIKQINTADSTMEEKLTQSFETIATASAQNTMQRSLGHHAMQDSMKRVAESEVTNRQSDIKKAISQTINETSASATSASLRA